MNSIKEQIGSLSFRVLAKLPPPDGTLGRLKIPHPWMDPAEIMKDQLPVRWCPKNRYLIAAFAPKHPMKKVRYI